MRYLILLWILLAFGCRSTKQKSITITSDRDSTTVTVQQEQKVEFKSVLDLINQEMKMEERTETHQAFDSAGITVFKPVILTKSLAVKSEKISASRDSTVTQARDSVSGSVKSQDAQNLQLYKESEGQEIVGEIVGGVVGSFVPFWIKYFIAFLILLTGLVYWQWLRRKLKKEKDEITPSDSNPKIQTKSHTS
jgi:hypothetical protein